MRWLLPGGLLALVLALQWPLWFGEGGWLDVREMRAEMARQEAENERLLQRNEALQAEVRDLQEGLAAVEERARRDLGMIREDETFFFIVDEDDEVPDDLPELIPESEPAEDAADPEADSGALAPELDEQDAASEEDPFDE
ncbi:cell division protein FtsB [Thioalkalivibrio sp. ALJ24]|uniref:cell division protein FtsB n=1 Tax=Thioalkalivibrio sp. ALJ24 TaxID=545276 RepID=UPI00036A14EA|nr:cell division protein FtsB [Thioalkalivibrio sp. ALJ24]